MQCKEYNNNSTLLFGYLFFVCLVVSKTYDTGPSPWDEETLKDHDIPITEPLPSSRELSQFMSNHLLGNLHRCEILAVVNHELESYKVGYDGTCPRFCVDGCIIFE